MKRKSIALAASLTLNALFLVVLTSMSKPVQIERFSDASAMHATVFGKGIRASSMKGADYARSKPPPIAPKIPVLELPSSLLEGMGENTSTPRKTFSSLSQVPQSNLAFKEDAVDIPAEILKRIPPAYPMQAQEQGIEGFVEYRLHINVRGEVEHLTLVQAQPLGYFEENARKALKEFKFLPAQYHGQVVPVIVRQRLNFRLEK